MADPGTIAAKTNQALLQAMDAVHGISERLGLDPVDLVRPRHRNPFIQTMQRMEMLAEWATAVHDELIARQIDISGVSLVNEQLATIRWVLDTALPHMTKRQLEEIGAELGIEIHASIKQEIVNEIVLGLTGQELQTASLEDKPDEEASPDAPNAESDAETGDQVQDIENDDETPENGDFDAPEQESFEDED